MSMKILCWSYQENILNSYFIDGLEDDRSRGQAKEDRGKLFSVNVWSCLKNNIDVDS